MKVYGWVEIRGGVPLRCVCAAKSVAALMRAADLSRYFITQYAAVTGNDQELAAALDAPGTVFERPLDDHAADYEARR